MRTGWKIYLMVFLLVSFTGLPEIVHAGNIEAKLPGSDGSDAFQVQNSGGTALIHVQSDGNVGIGTMTPRGILDVKGDLIVDPLGRVTKPNQPAARAYRYGNIDISGPNRNGRNDYINIEDFDIGNNLDVAGGPIFIAPVAGTYLVTYRQGFRNPTFGSNTSTHWQYGIYLRINGSDDSSYYSAISNKDNTTDYIYAEFTDIIQLNAGDIVEAMESIDFGAGGTLQKNTASFSIVLLH